MFRQDRHNHKERTHCSGSKTFWRFTVDDALLYGTLASREENHDPIDDAVIAKASR